MVTLLYILTLSILSTSWVKFTPTHKDYSIEMKRTTKYKHHSVNEKAYADIYSVPMEEDENILAYKVVISKALLEEKLLLEGKDLEVYTKSYLSRCKCELSNQRLVQYKNFQGIVFDIKTAEGIAMSGESIHLVYDNMLYNINYFSPNEGKLKYMSEFDWVINSMIIYK